MTLLCMNFYWYNKNEIKLNPVKLYVIWGEKKTVLLALKQFQVQRKSVS